ncbi:Transcription elongation factor S-II central domain [Arabidopsis suecica]|uniref:Transcription elongation factor S-II central domain n=1 Tax=Arabidopsis suecica TaxID=45249 RepID=A0A8T2DJC2_ARASU|nr:Transcription elongation factor S-II central domain [Arabidopsis suecica]
MSSNMGTELIDLETVKADSDAFGETNLMELVGSNDPPSLQHISVSEIEQEPMEISVSGPLSFQFEPEAVSFQSSMLVDTQSLMPQLQLPYSVERSVAACSNSVTGKRKSPPESTLSGSATSEKLDASIKRVEPVHHRPWLEQFYSECIQRGHMPPPATLSTKTEHLPTPAKKVRQMEPASQKSGKQVMNKKQAGLSQGSVKTLNDGNESLRSKMKESLAAALALVHEHEESPKEKKNSETEEASVPVADSNEPASACGTSVTVGEDITPAMSTRDESFEQKNGNGRTLSQESSKDTKMNYVNQSDVQKTQFDEVFPCDDVRFSDGIFTGDELLQGNGLSWVLEPVSDFGENETQKSFEDPELLASKIELELFKLFGGVNKKYKEKGRSLLFNLKDKNNPELRESVMSGKISPERLCNMTAEELASKELSQWRQAKAEEMAEMVVLRDTDIDVRNLVRKTHKGEFQVEIDPVDSGTVDVSAEITSNSKPRAKAKSSKSSTKATLKKNDSNDKNIKSNQGTSSAVTLPPTEEIDPMQGLSMDDEMKDVGFLPPIVSLDEFMESLNSEPPFGSPHEHPPGKEDPASEKSDSKDGSHSKSPSRSPKQSPKEPSESVSSKTELEKTNVISPKPDAGDQLDGDVSKPENTSLVDSIKEDRIWDGILQLSSASVVSVTGIFKSGEKAKTSEWPTMVEVKGRVRLSAFGKFVKELPLSRSRVLMVMNVVCKNGISQSQRDSLIEVAKSYVADQRVGYAEPTSGVELYLCPTLGETLDLLSKIISKDYLDEVKCSEDIGLIGVVVWRRAVVASPGSRHKPGFKRQHSSTGTKRSVLAPENQKSRSVSVTNPSVVNVESMRNHGLVGCDDDDEDMPPGFGPVAAKDDDDLPEFNFNSSSGPVTSSPRPPSQSRSLDQVRELILKYGNSTGSGSKRPWDGHDDDDDDDIPEWQPQLPPPPPDLSPQFHSGTMARPPAQRPVAGPPSGWKANQNAPRQQQYSARRNRGF